MTTNSESTQNSQRVSEKIIGIDLGTTNSVIAILEGATPVVIPNSEGLRTTPSIIAFTPKGDVLVGQLAKRQSVVNPLNTFYSIKRFIGCNYEEIKYEVDKVAYKIFQDSSGKVKIASPLLKRDFSPEELSAVILNRLAEDASRFLKQDINKAVITVPAYFNDSQRLATKDAGKIAGLEVLRILNEPTAAALAYGLDKRRNEVVLIFDLGGGTFDVSILEVGEEIFEVLSTSGDTHLGGNDFDNVIVDYILKRFRNEHSIDLSKDKQALQRVIDVAEKTKIELSVVESTIIDLPFISIGQGKTLDINYQLDRAEFIKLSANILEKCKNPVIKALEDAKLSKFDIDEVILVGGSTRIPAVRNLLVNLLGKKLNESVNPDEVVALGAAIQAGILAGEITDLILLDVTPLSLGVETLGGVMTTVIPRNSSVPARRSENFSTGEDFQQCVDIHVLQGERSFASDNKSLGIFRLNNIPPAYRGVPQIEVTFRLDVNGILSVSARDKDSGVEQSIDIQGASVLDREELTKLVEEAEKNSSFDEINKAFVDISNDLDNFFVEYERIKKEPFFGIDKKSTTYRYFCELTEFLKKLYCLNKFTDMYDILQELSYLFDCLVENWLEVFDENEIENNEGFNDNINYEEEPENEKDIREDDPNIIDVDPTGN